MQVSHAFQEDAWVYRWAAGLFLAPPGEPELALYRSEEGRAVLKALEAFPALAPAAACLRRETAQGADLGAAAARFAAAFSRAFLTANRRSVPPYASYWLSESGLLFQEPTREMNRFLRDLGMEPDGAVKEPADHLSVQLAVLAELVDRAGSDRPVPAVPERFARDHLLTWLPSFCRGFDGMREPFFYPELARGIAAHLSRVSRQPLTPAGEAQHARFETQ